MAVNDDSDNDAGAVIPVQWQCFTSTFRPFTCVMYLLAIMLAPQMRSFLLRFNLSFTEQTIGLVLVERWASRCCIIAKSNDYSQ
mmetsp:Transcript_16212/g.25296  ORF Transcript_16212/g.25296 Transcript_16212/m.25296 type:complete len:84 (+) Transcript_16212:25-276(+)